MENLYLIPQVLEKIFSGTLLNGTGIALLILFGALVVAFHLANPTQD